MSTPSVYLAGSIVGCTTYQAKGWRNEVTSSLDGWFKVYDPCADLRNLPDSEVYYQVEKPDHINSARAMYQRDLYMIQKSDVLVVKIDDNRKQIGSMFELGYAVALGKPVIFYISVHSSTPDHPFITQSGVICFDIQEVVEALMTYV